MTTQKHGFLLFLASLIPGAGELYMGFRKMGISLMVLFWGCIALSSLFNTGIFTYLLPIIWFYSFFNSHNLAGLSEEEFHSVEDHYFLGFEDFTKESAKYKKQIRTIIAVVLILLGIVGLWNTATYYVDLTELIPDEIYEYVSEIGTVLPSILLSIAFIVIGVKLIKGKKEDLAATETAPISEQEVVPDNQAK